MAEDVMSKIKTDLISTGIFLERDTFELFNSWKTEVAFNVWREYPYSYGTHPVITNGAIDILATTQIDDGEMVMIMPIECKKADPKLKHWVFEPHRPPNLSGKPFILFSERYEEGFCQDYNLPGLGYNTHSDYENCVNVFEFSETTGNISRQAERSLRAFFAIKQANEAVPGVLETNALQKVSPKLTVPNVIIPIVVTTANLWVTEYDPSDISKVTGDIAAAKLNLKSKDWVLYSYPLEFHESVKGQNRTGHAVGVITPEKRPTFIVRASALHEFTRLLIGDLQSHFRPRS